MSNSIEPGETARGLSRRPVERITAAILIALALIVLYDSYGRGAGWDNGPQNGFFPARVGWIFLAASLFILVQSLRSADDGVFVTYEQLGMVVRVLGPLLLFVALIQPLWPASGSSSCSSGCRCRRARSKRRSATDRHDVFQTPVPTFWHRALRSTHG